MPMRRPEQDRRPYTLWTLIVLPYRNCNPILLVTEGKCDSWYLRIWAEVAQKVGSVRGKLVDELTGGSFANDQEELMKT